MAYAKHYSFLVGAVRLVALNAFDVPDPGSFCLLDEQLDWLEEEIKQAGRDRQAVVLLLHCYPTDLKQGGERMRKLVESPSVRLIDMGHTHYNEQSLERLERDQDNAVEAWPERGLLGTQLGPNKNGRKW